MIGDSSVLPEDDRPSAHAIASRAHAQAIAAAEAERRAEDLRRIDKAREHGEHVERVLERGRVYLDEWFPGVEWTIADDRAGNGTALGYGSGVLVREAGAPVGDPLKLLIESFDGSADGGSVRTRIYFAELAPKADRDTGMNYYSCVEVKSAADVGRILANRAARILANRAARR